MPVKNAVAKAWQKTGGGTPLASYDGKIYSGYLNGDKPAGFVLAPKIVGTDIDAITLVNNYNGKGSWFKVFGYALGTSANFGLSTGAKVYLRDPAGDNVWYEVYSYVEYATSRTFARNQLLRLCVQVGNLGGSQVNGRSLDLKVTVNGVDSNILTAKMINQGPRNFYFASPAGSDSTGAVNDINHPYRYIQNASGGTYLGIWSVWKPGDTIVIRGNGGTWTDQLAACQNRWAQFPWGPAFPVTTGTPPTGNTSGTLTGYYTFYGMPGEDVHASLNNGGGIEGCDSARAQAGSGQYVQIAGLRIDIQGGAQRDAGPINLQSGADHWIVRDNEAGPWVAGSSTVLNSSAIGGQGSNCSIQFNYCHDIEGLSDLQNHGMYFGGVSGGTGYDNASFNMDVSYNWIKNCTGGSGVQFYWQGGNSKYMYGNTVHHNYIENTAKYGLNAGESTIGMKAWNNIITHTGWNSIRWAGPSGQTFAGYFEHNTCNRWNNVLGSTTMVAAILQDGFANAGTVQFNHNIFCGAASRGGINLDWYVNNGGSDSNLTFSQNLYFDPDGVHTTVLSTDATGIYGNPLFNSTTQGSTLVLQSGSPALDAAANAGSGQITVSDDFYGISRPQGANKDIGACEGVGT